MTLEARTWWQDDPRRLDREQADVASVAPDLRWVPEGAGRFEGEIPVWPFTRQRPVGLDKLVPAPAKIEMRYSHAFPAVPPTIISTDPAPELILRSFADFHVLPNGGLCLLRDASQWTLQSQTSELVLKASSWVIEYALLRAGHISRMTLNGIVEDAEHDELIAKHAEVAR